MTMGSVGVDIGATGVRVVEVSGLDGQSLAQVKRAAVHPLSPGAVVAGKILDVNQVAFAVNSAFKKAGVSPYGAVVGITSTDATVARVAVSDKLKPNQWLAALRLKSKSISPKLTAEQAALGVHRLPEDIGEGEIPILVGATTREEVALINDACKKAKLTPRAIDLAAVATMRCMTRVPKGSNDVSTLVDIGATQITVATRQGANLRSVTTMERGSEEITRALMGTAKLKFDEAEIYKRQAHLGMSASNIARAQEEEDMEQFDEFYDEVVVEKEPDMVLIAEKALVNASESLVDDIAAAVELDSGKYPSTPTQGIVLCGGGALLQGIKERISEQTGVPVALGRPWATIKPGKHTSSVLTTGVDEATALVALSTAIGLAMWEGVK